MIRPKRTIITRTVILCGIAVLYIVLTTNGLSLLKNLVGHSAISYDATAALKAVNTSFGASLSNSSISSTSNQSIHAVEQKLEALPSFTFSGASPSLTYQLVRHRPYNLSGHSNKKDSLNKYECRITKPPNSKSIENRTELPSQNPFHEFSTYIQTNLNILFMGDSLAVEFGSWFQIATQAPHKTVLETLNKWQGLGADKAPPHGLTVASARHGGGVIAYWRLLGFWEERTAGRSLPNRGFGWYKRYVTELLAHTKAQGQGEQFHVLLFRISHPWVWSKGKDFVSHQKMTETVRMARKYLGRKVIVIFQTAPFNNNVVTTDDLRDFRAMNDLIRSFVANTTLSSVLLSDIAYYMDNVMQWNAHQLGMTAAAPKKDDNATAYLAELLKATKGDQRHHIAQVCSERVTHDSESCRGNMLSNDGLHLCMETLGPRLNANWACLIQCAYNTSIIVRKCERRCNEKYFTLDEHLLPAANK
mmetsp:Transcript_9023/g.15067  ORF Transcript_9023/g.15067 Transcript_9023/m.15067 type:complete len:475 (+) Transcript_9023:69-1493(+)